MSSACPRSGCGRCVEGRDASKASIRSWPGRSMLNIRRRLTHHHQARHAIRDLHWPGCLQEVRGNHSRVSYAVPSTQPFTKNNPSGLLFLQRYYLRTTTGKEPLRFTDSFACRCTDPGPSMRSLPSSPLMIETVHPQLVNSYSGPLAITGRLTVAQLCPTEVDRT